MKNSEMHEKVIVITGASSEFGKGIALAFAERGASVVLAARRRDLLEDLAYQCEFHGGKALAIPTDVSKRDDVEKLAQASLAGYGRIDLWINNAGAGAPGRFGDVPLTDHLRVIETNLLGTLYGSYAAWTQFKKQNSGTLINIASAPGKIPALFNSSYAASKYAIVGLCDALREELRENPASALHVCTVMPTAMDAFFFDHEAPDEAEDPPPMEGAQDVLEQVLDLARNPKEEVIIPIRGNKSTEERMPKETPKVPSEFLHAAPEAASASGHA